MTSISRGAVIGSGVMGAGIAAHMANAGLSVVLLDVVPQGATDRSVLAKHAIERLGTARPPAFAEPDVAGLIRTGNMEDDLDLLVDVQWVVEAVVENLVIKRDVIARIAAAAPDAAICSNTSTLSLSALTEGLSQDVAERVMITHFFNPPRQMRLVEVVGGPRTSPSRLETVRNVVDRQMGKMVVDCADTPGFIANRLGTYWMALAVAEAFRQDISPAEADAVLSAPFGIPPTGVFGLLDLIGIDTVEKGCRSLLASLPKDDPFHGPGEIAASLFKDMAGRGLLGRKVKAGFMRTQPGSDGAPVRQDLDLRTLDYGEAVTVSAKSLPGGGRDPLAMISASDRLGRYAWSVMSGTLAYACGMVPQVSANPADIDDAMTLGYGWRQGPFRLMDAIGPDVLKERFQTPPSLLREVSGPFFQAGPDGRSVAVGGGKRLSLKRGAGIILAEDLRRAGLPVIGGEAASLWDMGDGVALFEIHRKMNTLDDEVGVLLSDAQGIVGERFKALVIGSDAANFSAGADLAKTLGWIRAGDFVAMERTLAAGQQAMLDIKYAPFPVVAALAGAALGGGCEIVLHCDAVQAHLECSIGLVERNVGILPGWGGIAQMLARYTEELEDPIKGGISAFELIAHAVTCSSAHQARRHLFLRSGDRVSMNRDRLLADAKELAVSMVPGYRAPERVGFAMGSPAQRIALAMAVSEFGQDKDTSPYDSIVADALAWVLGGGERESGIFDESDVHALERTALLRLARDERTQARMEHMLATGKSLRN